MEKCPLCGKVIPLGQVSCPDCGGVSGSAVYEPSELPSAPPPVEKEKPADSAGSGSPGTGINGTPYLIWSVCNTLFCCLPLGIAGALYANKASKAQTREEGEKHLKTARILCVIGTLGGFVVQIILFAVNLAGS